MQSLTTKITNLSRRAWRARGLLFRLLFCWAIGSALPFFDEVKNYDFRFRLRGPQDVSKSIVLVTLDEQDWPVPVRNYLHAHKEHTVINDAYFWNANEWNQLLDRILTQGPRAVGVTFFFSDQLPYPDESLHALSDPRVVWAAQLDGEGHVSLPLMANSYGHNAALVDLTRDQDQVVRNFAPPPSTLLPHMGIQLAEANATTAIDTATSYEGHPINFRGDRSTFGTLSAKAVFEGRVPPNFFANRIVLIGSRSQTTAQYQTPLGPMSRLDILAQILDNVTATRWITRLSPAKCSLYLLFVLLIAVTIVSHYPQGVALAFLMWLGLGTTAFSIWFFDSFYFWIPAISPLLLSAVAYVVFIGYQLTLQENLTWRLEQEKTLLSELDNLRNNFVSLISHDLKTPIAKIQAICDRLLAGPVTPEVKQGLFSLRRESVELHRYIQSILQISRLESSQLQVRREAIDVNELVTNVLHQLRPLAEDKHQRILPQLEPMFSIEADAILLQEVILNLVENAIKYTAPEGQIVVATKEVDDKVVVTVADNGPGIGPADQEHLFEKFFRGRAEKSQVKGTGLGLFLVKYFIELHGGEVFLESALGKGTRVGFTLPLQMQEGA